MRAGATRRALRRWRSGGLGSARLRRRHTRARTQCTRASARITPHAQCIMGALLSSLKSGAQPLDIFLDFESERDKVDLFFLLLVRAAEACQGRCGAARPHTPMSLPTSCCCWLAMGREEACACACAVGRRRSPLVAANAAIFQSRVTDAFVLRRASQTRSRPSP